MRSHFIRTPGLFSFLFPDIEWCLPEENDGKIELTFDDGPNPYSTPILLELLAHYQIRSTFFITGRKAENHPELVQSILNRGHIIGNHGYDHMNGWKTSTQDYLRNIQSGQEIHTSSSFRPPYGRMTRAQYQSIRNKTGLKIKMWTLMPGDFNHEVGSDLLYKRLIKYTRSRDIIVLHDTPTSVEKLGKVLDPYMQWLNMNKIKSTPETVDHQKMEDFG